MKRVVLIVMGVLLVLVGLAAAATGAVLATTFGKDGSLTVESGSIAGDGSALVTDNLDVGGTPLQERLGEVTFGARAVDGGALFIGLAPADDVFGYLDGVRYDVVTGVGGTAGTTVRPVPGDRPPAAATAQSFWVAQASGVDPQFVWPGSTAPDVRLVVMNADGTPYVAATLVVGFTSDTVYPIALTSMIAGAVAFLLGVLLLVLAERSRRRARPTPDAVAGPVAPGAAVVVPAAAPAGSAVPVGPAAPEHLAMPAVAVVPTPPPPAPETPDLPPPTALPPPAPEVPAPDLPAPEVPAPEVPAPDLPPPAPPSPGGSPPG